MSPPLYSLYVEDIRRESTDHSKAVKIGRGVRQSCIMSLPHYNLYVEDIRIGSTVRL